ncbi:MAG: FkbM family methyltransferase [Actinomycetota bacterium]|nr:FkbM family methyltransferase [Actinomycetota bacterium]
MPPTAVTPLIACTVVSCVDLPAARIAARTYLDHHPGARFVTLLVDGPTADDGDLVGPSDLGIGADELAVLATGHTTAEACVALRPRLLDWLLATQDNPVLYLDPWVRVYAPFADVITSALADVATVLVPRVLLPLPDDGHRPTHADLRATGIYDDGLLAVARGAEHFLHAWAEVSGRSPERAGVFLDGAPTYVDHRVLRDPGLGLSRWNASQRPVTKAPELMSGGAPLRTANFAGFDSTRPWLLTADIADHPRVLLSEHPLLSRLCVEYAAEIPTTAPSPTVLFGQLTDGTALPAPLRAAFRVARGPVEFGGAVLSGRSRNGVPAVAFRATNKGKTAAAVKYADPLTPAVNGTGAHPARPPAATVDPTGFLRWACAPDPHIPDANRWAVALWEDDPDLRKRFPQPFGADAGAYRDWCATDAVLAGRLHPRAIPGQPSAEVALVDQIGVSVLGTGPLADRVRIAAQASGLPTSDEPIYPVVLACGGLTGVPRQRHVIAVRDEFGPLPAAADERWLAWPTALPGTDGVTTHTVPLPTPDPGARDDSAREDARHALGLTDEPTFIALADQADDLLAVFTAAFPTRSDVRLLLLVPKAVARTETTERLRLAADPRVRLIVDESGFDRAVDAATWAISPHEPGDRDTARVATWLTRVGFRGVPVVAIAGGTASELLADGCVSLRVDQFAADTMLAGAIRDLADDTATATTVGGHGRDHLLNTLAPGTTGAILRRRVELAYRSWRAGRVLASATDDDPLRALRTAKHALLRRPDVDAGYRIPMAPALRRAVLRVLDHYDNHLNSVLASLIDGIERTVVELVERQERLATAGSGPDVDLLRADLDLVVERNTQLSRQVSATGEEVMRLRGEVAGGVRSVDELTARVRGTAESDHLRALTEAFAASQARMDALETRLAEQAAAGDGRRAMDSWSADQALRTADALRRVVVGQHERVDFPDVADVPNSLVLCDAGLIRLPAEDAVMSAVLSSNGVWEPEIAELVDALIEPESVFLDVGAYVGYHAIRVLGRLGTSGTVVAVEPHPDAVKLLRHNVSQNVSGSVAERLHVLTVAAWDSQKSLVAAPATGGGYGLWPQDQERVTTDTPNEVAFPGVRLDRELDGLAAAREQRLSVVKVDVPGRGHRVLGGLVRRLRKDRPHVIFAFDGPLTTGFGDDPAVVLREFRTWGYDIVRLGDDRPVGVEEVVSEVLSGQVRTLWLRPSTSR